MTALLTVITALNGSRAGCSWALARGTDAAGAMDTVMAGAIAVDTTVDADTTAAVVIMADAGTVGMAAVVDTDTAADVLDMAVTQVMVAATVDGQAMAGVDTPLALAADIPVVATAAVVDGPAVDSAAVTLAADSAAADMPAVDSEAAAVTLAVAAVDTWVAAATAVVDTGKLFAVNGMRGRASARPLFVGLN